MAGDFTGPIPRPWPFSPPLPGSGGLARRLIGRATSPLVLGINEYCYLMLLVSAAIPGDRDVVKSRHHWFGAEVRGSWHREIVRPYVGVKCWASERRAGAHIVLNRAGRRSRKRQADITAVSVQRRDGDRELRIVVSVSVI